MELEILREVGLSKGEINVYSAILKIGVSTINKIHEKTGIERRNIYDILNKLIEKSLISYITEKGKRTYQCSNPNKLLENIKRKKELLEKLEIKFPEIIKLYKAERHKIMAEIYRGKEGIKCIFEEMLNYQENYFIGGGWYIIKEMPYYWLNYNRRRIEKGVVWYNLVRYDLKRIKNPNEKLMFIKFLPKELSGNPLVIFIYGDKVVNVLWSEEYFAFMIESKEIAENYKKYHEYLWEKIAKTK